MGMFAKNLRGRIELLGLSQAEVARRAGISERRLGNYATGIREPEFGTLARLADVLGITIDALIRGSGAGGPDRRTVLIERLEVAAKNLDLEQMEALVVQAEALVTFSNKRTSH